MLYGHHMDSGTMFQNLMYCKDKPFYDEHLTARLITPDGSYTVEFFAGYVPDASSDAWKSDLTSAGDFEDRLAATLEQSMFERKVMSTAPNRIVTLSACGYEFCNARFVLLHGRLVFDWRLHFLSDPEIILSISSFGADPSGPDSGR